MPKKFYAAFFLSAAILISLSVTSIYLRKTRPVNIVLIVIDALRKDHLGTYGYERDTTPIIDYLAENGLVFENAVSQAPWTTASVTSIFTSKYPTENGVRACEDAVKRRHIVKIPPSCLDKGFITLADVLKDNGYRTGCLMTNPYASAKFGLTKGFDEKHYLITDENKKPNAYEVVDAAIDIIEKGSRQGNKKAPFFLYLHFMDMHNPLIPPPPHNNLYPALDSAPNNKRHAIWPDEYNNPDALNTEKFKIFKSHRLSLYDGALRFVDLQIARLVDYLLKEDLYENTVIVIASDHGEEFWDHAVFEKRYLTDDLIKYSLFGYGMDHGHTMFRELLDVPLIFHGKGVPKKRVRSQVRNIDIMPTVLGLAGIAEDNLDMDGIDMVGRLKHGSLEDMPAFSEDIAYGFEKKCIQDSHYKYIMNAVNKDEEFLFDKTNDPLETVDISKKKPEIKKLYRDRLDGILAGLKRHSVKKTVVDEKTKEQLRSLGYAQ